MSKETVTVRQIQRLDHIAIEKYGVPSLALMENAGRSVAAQVLKVLKGRRKPKVCIFCGLGNNAGDGFVVARHLLNAGIDIKIFLVGSAKNLKNDAKINYQILKKCGYAITEIKKPTRIIEKEIARATVIVDAIFGVGLSREILDPFKGVIDVLNKYGKCIIAVDIPSGLDGTTGNIYGVCVKADRTVTFSFLKKGFLKKYGPQHVGKAIVVDIGIPKRLMNRL